MTNPNTGHGHVRPRPDGVKARCGGPALCGACREEAKAMKKLLFLDVDGVLNNHARWPNRWSGIQYDKVQVFNRLLEAVENLEIVLSSAWRYRFRDTWAIEGLLCVHGLDALGRVHGLTAQDAIPDEHPSFDDMEWWSRMGLRWRAEQVREYVAAHRPSRWAVLDDLPLDIEHLFQTDPTIGVTAELVARMIAHFSGEGD